MLHLEIICWQRKQASHNTGCKIKPDWTKSVHCCSQGLAIYIMGLEWTIKQLHVYPPQVKRWLMPWSRGTVASRPCLGLYELLKRSTWLRLHDIRVYSLRLVLRTGYILSLLAQTWFMYRLMWRPYRWMARYVVRHEGHYSYNPMNLPLALLHRH